MAQTKSDLMAQIQSTPYIKSMQPSERNKLIASLKSMDIAFLEKSLVKLKKRNVEKTKTNKSNISSGVVLKSSPPPSRPKPLIKKSKPVVKKSKTKEAEPRTIAQAKSMGKDYFMVTNKKGDDIKKAAVTAEELKKSGLSLRDYLNKKRGLKRKTKK